ncbi:MAG: hypothetical protein KDH96_06500 [Candidatus Riesia sp.]|nr:hypothetical protein [Candidatus Riesia sp.]
MNTPLSKLDIISFVYNFTQHFSSHEYPMEKYIEEFKKTNDFSSVYLDDIIGDFCNYIFIDNGQYHEILDSADEDYTSKKICIFKYEDNIFKVKCDYVSHTGLLCDTISICIVDTFDIQIETYEIKRIKESINQYEFEYIVNTIRTDFNRNQIKDHGLDEVVIGDNELLCYKLYNWFNTSTNLFRDDKFNLRFVDIVVVYYDTDNIVFKINEQHYMFTVDKSLSYDDIKFSDCYIKKVTPKVISYIDYE